LFCLLLESSGLIATTKQGSKTSMQSTNRKDFHFLNAGETAVSIGKFDAIHLGHKKIINRLVEVSKVEGLTSVVLTFDRHPNHLLNPESTPVPVIGKTQKLEELEHLGVDHLVTLEFDAEVAKLTPVEFVQEVLLSSLHAKYVVVGSDFRFGSGAEGDVSALREFGEQFGFEVEVVEKLKSEGLDISTSGIRNALLEGQVALAGELLGRNHSTVGIVVHGLKNGRKLGYPTANLSRDAEGMLPKDGVYAGWLYSGEDKFMAALSVGTNETVTAVPRVLEAHVLDRDDLDLYDQVVKVEYVDLIRPNLKFSGIDELVFQIGQDVESARTILTKLG